MTSANSSAAFLLWNIHQICWKIRKKSFIALTSCVSVVVVVVAVVVVVLAVVVVAVLVFVVPVVIAIVNEVVVV